ncbi:MAG: TRAP transporter small permease subunit [Proteobacteria bacterium]|nr:TRAP transporter small permease subunit [Pseudomonadota bacterium]
MQGLLALSRAIDGVSRRMGIVANWLVLLAALACALDAIMRYSVSGLLHISNNLGAAGGIGQLLFDLYRNNSNTLRDLQLFMFAGMVMLGASWTLKVNEHVRVDLFYTWVSDRTRIWIDTIGCVAFLMPFCIIMIYFSWPWFMESWNTSEMSVNAGGMARWPVKLFFPVGFALILLQGVSELIKCAAALSIGYRREHAYEKPLQ